MTHLSLSQIKKYMKTPSAWAGAYLLGIRDEYKNDAMITGTAFHLMIENGGDKKVGVVYLEKHKEDIIDMYKALDGLHNLYINYNSITTPKAEKHEVEFNKDIGFGMKIKGFVDGIVGNTILEYKSAGSLSYEDDSTMSWQAQNNYEEYKLQCWIYMRATGLKKAIVIEVMKKDAEIKRAGSLRKSEIINLCKDFDKKDKKLTINDIITKYKPKRTAAQLIEFNMTDKFDKEMYTKYSHIVNEMVLLYKKYKKVLQ